MNSRLLLISALFGPGFGICAEVAPAARQYILEPAPSIRSERVMAPPPADITLLDRRFFKTAEIIAEYPTRVMIRHAGGLAVVNKDLLPDALWKRYPVDDDAAAAEATNRALEAERAAARRAKLEDRRIESAQRLAEQRQANASAPGPAASEIMAAEQVADAETAAVEHVIQYVETGRRTGSGNTLVFGVKVYPQETREIPGWFGRREVSGICTYKVYDSVWGGSFKNRRIEFKVQVETKTGSRSKIVDFTQSR